MTEFANQFTHSVAASVDSHAAQEKDGALQRRQRGILQLLAEAGPMGLTSQKIEELTGENHGKVSGALSAMHREGMVAALKLDRRNGFGVYVLPGQVQNRLVRAYQPNAKGKPQEKAAPVAPARPRLTADELTLVAGVRANLNASPDSIVRLYPSTARALLAAIDRLNA